jgi:hypothetical protein
MGLSRLENFLRSVRGNIIYVDPNALDSTDSIENDGTSAARPFKTLQRALIEAARFSYLPGPNNDKFGNTTILLYPGEHTIDNRPGWIPITGSTFLKRDGTTSSDFYEFDLRTDFDINSSNNALYKFNSVHGGIIVPRGTSIVGYDLRKTKIRPKYVPDPENDNIERSAIFRLTGACYLWQMSIFDANPNGVCYKDYTNNTFVPNFSHNKLTAFEYADGANTVEIDDVFNTYTTDRTDLDIYYEKIGLAYGNSSGTRQISPDYPSVVDIQTKVDEYRIVGSRGEEVGISSIQAGDGLGGGDRTEITVTLAQDVTGLDVDTPIRINGVGISTFNGQYVVKEVVSSNEIKYSTSYAPPTGVDSILGQGTLNIVVDTVTSASPYIFNCSLRSVYGLCGLHADGSSVDGFKSMVVAQFTGISLQKDNNAFVKYDPTSGVYVDATNVANIYSDSLAKYKPSYESYHIKASNDAFIQCVSIFAIGYAQHFEADSGGDMSITNSNSNFGAKSLLSKGFRGEKFIRDDLGYISHIVAPKEITSTDITIEFDAIDISKTISIGDSSRLYLYNQTNENSKPIDVIDGYRIGAKQNDQLNLIVSSAGISTTYSATIVMEGTSETTYQKEYNVAKLIDGQTNDISANTITLSEPHDFINGETVRIVSDTGEIPDGLDHNSLYYVITDSTATSLTTSQIRLASSLNDAQNGAISSYAINILTQKTSNLKIVSRVSDKVSGDIGHPIQYDSFNGQWYLNVNSGNQIYNTILSSGTDVSSRTYIVRTPDNRNYEDTLYKFRYVIPRDSSVKARPPLDGFVIQDSTSLPLNGEINSQYSPDNATKTLSNSTELKSTRFISNASWSGSVATIQTELPHRLSVGSLVEVVNVLSSNNPSGFSTSGYNGTYTVTSIPSRKQFSYSLTSNPGTFLDNTSTRNTSLPYFNRKRLPGTYVVYKTDKVQEYIQNQQDGIYHVSVINSSNNPTVAPFEHLRLLQPVQYLYPQLDRDNVVSDPEASHCYALSDPIGQVVINDPQKSITKETLEDFLFENKVGFGITDIISNSAGTAHTIYTNIDHGLNPITGVTITNPGSAYGTTAAAATLYNARLVGGSGEGASAVVKINTSGQITDIEVMDGGSRYQVGNVLSVVGIATRAGHTVGTVTVASIYNHSDEVIKLEGILKEDYRQYNNLYRITGISSTRSIQVASAGAIANPSTTGVGITATLNSNAYLTGKSFTVSAFTYNNTTGIANITLSSGNSHGLSVNDKVRIYGATSSLFNGEFLVTKVISLVRFEVNIGTSSSSPSTAGTKYILPIGYSSMGGNNVGKEENRIISQYAGIQGKTSSTISQTDASIDITDAKSLGLKIGNYIQIDDEIMKIYETVTGDSVSVFRGLLGTRNSTHSSGSVVKKVYPYPIELRRHSILRASGHTFEYVGFGPGNYSSAFPDRQDRQITEQEELLSQSFKSDGGINVYTAMNNDGDFYIGNKKVSSANGQEEVFDAPVPSVRGEEIFVETGTIAAINITNTENLTATRSIRVEGGRDGNVISEFNGPVVFNDKITSNSSRGVEANSLYLQGNSVTSRKYTVGISTPIIAANSGDVEFYSAPEDGGYLGWVYTLNNEWRKFAPIQNSNGQYVGIWSGTFFGDGSGLTNLDSSWTEVGIGTIYSLANVGIGTSVIESNYKLKVKGTTYIDGILNVTEIIEKATIVTSAWPSLNGLGNPIDINLYLGDNNVYYYTTNVDRNWAVNFTGYSNGTTLNQLLNVGDSITVAFLAQIGSIPYYNTTVKIDGTTIAPKWYGGFVPTAGNAGSIDSYTYVIIKTGNNAFTVLASQSQYG